jgi:TP901-1 family phage major tail protein
MATNGIINGTKFGIYDNSSGSPVLVAFATSGSISINHSARETSNKESGGWKEVMEGQRDWEISVEGMVAFKTLAGAAVAGSTMDEIFTAYITTRGTFLISFESSESGDKKYSGYAYLASISMDAPNEESTTYSCSFTGTSTLTQATS